MTDRVHNYGGPGKVSRQGMKVTKTAPTTWVGDIKPLAMGREMIYCYVTAAVSGAGIVYGTPPNVAGHSNNVVKLTASIGATEVTMCAVTTAIAKDQYKDGFLLVNDGVGEGQAYMIQGHQSAAANSGTLVVLKDGLEFALTTASEVTLVPNKGNRVIPIGSLSGTVTAMPCAISIITAAAGSYLWMGKCGPWPCMAGATPVAGEDAYVSSAGVDVLSTAATTFHRVGKFMTTAAATEFVMVDVQL